MDRKADDLWVGCVYQSPLGLPSWFWYPYPPLPPVIPRHDEPTLDEREPARDETLPVPADVT